jgi:hypothetical protein
MDEAQRIIETLGLAPLEPEGGWFRETWRDPRRDADGRSLGTAILYLITAGTCSTMHRVRSDEVFHFHLGDPVECLLLEPGAGGRRLALGPDLAAGQRPQIMVPRGAWQGHRLYPGGRWALLGCTMAPGFEFADFEGGDPAALVREFPAFAEDIRARSR